MNIKPTSRRTVTFSKELDKRLSRREFIGAGATTSVALMFGGAKAFAGQPSVPLAFAAIPTHSLDTVTVPRGYKAEVLISWGDSLHEGTASLKHNERPTVKNQHLLFGDNNDGMSFFTLGKNSALLAINNEYTNYPYLFSHMGLNLSADDVKTAQAAVGVSIIEIEKTNGQWQFKNDSKFNRRIHASTPMRISGPAAGHSLMRTSADPKGETVYGTFANCANGQTPWGTYLTCEENFSGAFGSSEKKPLSKGLQRYGFRANPSRSQWDKHDPRFDLKANPNEANRFGWVVEIDPYNPGSTPIKRTALGRFSHENAAFTLSKDNRAVVYMGDDAKGEYIYRYVSKGTYKKGDNKNNQTLLDDGTLYVAKFEWHKDKLAGNGSWIPLTLEHPALKKHFKGQGDILIHARMAADAVGATPMDRPEWVAVNPNKVEAYCTLTNNSERGNDDQPVGGPNPRAQNRYGQIVRWQPAEDHTHDTFTWDLFVLAGHPEKGSTPLERGSTNITKGNMFNSPDGLGFAPDGSLWILTDGNDSNAGPFEGMGNNQMLAANPKTGNIKRFLVGPTGSEVTGLCFSPDQTAMFVGIQHPRGHFPNGGTSIPRSSVLRVYREDGGMIGS